MEKSEANKPSDTSGNHLSGGWGLQTRPSKGTPRQVGEGRREKGSGREGSPVFDRVGCGQEERKVAQEEKEAPTTKSMRQGQGQAKDKGRSTRREGNPGKSGTKKGH